ncbi:MAG: hypothetical protein COA58_04915 [Bacteroidetes bacterium]|nr:MAG: hypothetical protein COA58_04915 [Bacteroidota bacterium]
MKKYFSLLIICFLSFPAFSGIVIYNRNSSGAGPDGYDRVVATGVSVGNTTIVSIQCNDPGSAPCPKTVNLGIPAFEEQCGVWERDRLNEIILQVDQQLNNGSVKGSEISHYFNVDDGKHYFYQAIWFQNSDGEQITQILKL